MVRVHLRITRRVPDTDEAYRTQFIAEHRMMSFVTDKDGKPIEDPEIIDSIKKEALKLGIKDENGIKEYYKNQLDKGRNIYQLRELSDQERNHLQKITYTDPNTGKEASKIVVAFNGIFNDIQDAAKFAVQNYVAGKGENGRIDQRIYQDIYFVHDPKTNNAISELMVAGYHKVLEGRVSGLSNSGLQALGIMKQYGQDSLFIGSHSRGTMTVNNAMRVLNTQENQGKGVLSDTEMKMVGAAANLNDANHRLNQLRDANNPTSIRVEGYKGDIVHEKVGGNSATRTVNTQNKGWLQVLKEILGSQTSSVHNCHGLGQIQCVTDGYRENKDDLQMHRETTVDELEKTKKDKR